MRCEKSKLGKVLYLTLIVIALRVIMLTQSRTAFVGVLVFGFLVWFFGRNKLLSLFAVVLTCIVLWQFSPQQTKDRFLTLLEVDKVLSTDRSDFTREEVISLGSMAGRWELIKRGLVAFKENPILGVGLQCFISFNGYRYGYWFPPHNTYIQALAEMGIIGFGVFMYVIFRTFANLRESSRIIKELGEKHTFKAQMVLALTVYFIIRIVVSMFGQDLYANYWWLSGGLSLVLLRVIIFNHRTALQRERES